MSELKTLEEQVRGGVLNRRDFLALASALGVSMAAASTIYSRAARAAEPKKGGRLVMGLGGGGTTDTMDPGQWENPVPIIFGRCWGEQLTGASPKDGTVVPVLAESWDSSQNGSKWVFKIRNGVTFHNGKTLTAEDVAATYQRHADKKSSLSTTALFTGMRSVQATAPNEVTFELATPNVDWPVILSDIRIIIQPNGGKDDPNAGIGTGAYRVQTAEAGVRYVGEKYPSYWRDLGHFDSVEIRNINDSTARTSALLTGDVHVINRVEPKTAGRLKTNSDIVIRSTPGKGIYGFVMRCDTPPFDNPDLRMALKLAIDREQILRQVLLGFGTLGNDFPINAAYDLFPEDIEQRKYDPEKAAALYKKSGHSGPIPLLTSEAAFPGAVDAAALYQQSAARAGINLDLHREPSDGYWSSVWNVKPFCATYWGGGPSQDQIYSSMYLSDAVWNDTAWRRPDFDTLLLQARGELDRKKRKDMYRRLGMMVRDDAGSVFPVFNNWLDAHRSNIEGWVDDPSWELSGRNFALICWFA
jgi:peptide/nickel transport system substrate-binding protein